MSSWPYYAGGAALVAFVVWLRERTISAPAAVVDPPPGKLPDRWVELTGPDVFMFSGDVYRACIDVPGVVPNSLVMSEIRKRAPALGFRDVSVQEGPPAGFPKSSQPGDCDVFAQATWVGADGVKLPRDSHISGAWRLARA